MLVPFAVFLTLSCCGVFCFDVFYLFLKFFTGVKSELFVECLLCCGLQVVVFALWNVSFHALVIARLVILVCLNML